MSSCRSAVSTATCPWLYLLLHFNLLLTLTLMAGKVREVLSYRMELTPSGEWRPLSKRLIGFPMVQVLVGEQDSFLHLLLALLVWITLVLVPLGIMLWLLIGYLPAQDESVLAWQRVALTLDAVALLLLWPRITSNQHGIAWWLRFVKGVTVGCLTIVTFSLHLLWILLYWLFNNRWRWTEYVRRCGVGLWPPQFCNKHLVEVTVLLSNALLVIAIAWFAAVIPGSEWERRLLATCERDYSQSLAKDSCRWWPTWVLFDWERRNEEGKLLERARFQRTLDVREVELGGAPMTPQQVAAFRGNDAAVIEQVLSSVAPINLRNSLLRYADLSRALLPKADLREAQLQGADLGGPSSRAPILQIRIYPTQV